MVVSYRDSSENDGKIGTEYLKIGTIFEPSGVPTGGTSMSEGLQCQSEMEGAVLNAH